MSAITIAHVHAFCDAHRAAGGGYRACNTCPIQSCCHSGCDPLTQANLDAFNARCVAALETAQAVSA